MDLLAVQHAALAEEIEHRAQFRRPSVVVPLRFSARITSHPAAFNAASGMDKSCSMVLTCA